MRSTDAIASAPGRVNLIGEHLDYNGGRSLPIALPLRTRAAVALRDDDALNLRSVQAPADQEGWTAYALGVLDELRRAGVDIPGLDLLVDGQVPLGAGLSSSAALEVAVALAVLTALGVPLDEVDLVDVCVRAENEHVGAPTGRMDQTVAVHATAGNALLIDFESGAVHPVPWQPPGELLVVDSGVRHAHATGEYAVRRAECRQAADLLGLSALAVATAADLARIPPRLAGRVRHVVTEQARVDDLLAAVRAGDWVRVGAVMTASHRSLRDDFEVSSPELDVIVEAALSAGALGARMTGGGFGGCAIALVPPGRADDVRTAVTAAYETQGWAEPEFYAGTASDGACVESEW